MTSTLALAVTAGTAAVPVAALSQSSPWAVDTYVRNGQPVGNIQHFCDGESVTYGDTTTYDYIHHATFYMCP